MKTRLRDLACWVLLTADLNSRNLFSWKLHCTFYHHFQNSNCQECPVCKARTSNLEDTCTNMATLNGDRWEVRNLLDGWVGSQHECVDYFQSLPHGGGTQELQQCTTQNPRLQPQGCQRDLTTYVWNKNGLLANKPDSSHIRIDRFEM